MALKTWKDNPTHLYIIQFKFNIITYFILSCVLYAFDNTISP
jgi:hypothetical protein